MFGLSWEQIFIILLVGVFLLGPERIPVAVQWVTGSLRKVRDVAAGAQAQLRTEIGPELDELRRQISELQSLKEVQDLRDLRDLHPRRIIGRNILGDEFSGGLTGMLGLKDPLKPAAAAAPAPPVDASVPATEPAVAASPAATAAAAASPAPAFGTRIDPPFDADAT